MLSAKVRGKLGEDRRKARGERGGNRGTSEEGGAKGTSLASALTASSGRRRTKESS